MTIIDTLLCRKAKATPADAAPHEASFGFWVGTAFTVNYIMGCGFLGMPEGFVKAVCMLHTRLRFMLHGFFDELCRVSLSGRSWFCCSVA
jgi:hypothetical protein